MPGKNTFRHRRLVVRRILLAGIHSLLGSFNIYFSPESFFGIKKGYHHARFTEVFDDKLNKDEWQRNVYESCFSLMKKINGKSITDVGCGSAYKLMAMFGNYDTMGIELEETFNWLQNKYPERKWLSFKNTDPSKLESDLVICSDVVEHVKNPDELMDFLKKMKFRQLVISTPERDSIRGKRDFGPPENTSHYREWNKEEFKNYVSAWFRVNEQMITKDKSTSQILCCSALV
jgi:hypothetical protein